MKIEFSLTGALKQKKLQGYEIFYLGKLDILKTEKKTEKEYFDTSFWVVFGKRWKDEGVEQKNRPWNFNTFRIAKFKSFLPSKNLLKELEIKIRTIRLNDFPSFYVGGGYLRFGNIVTSWNYEIFTDIVKNFHPLER